MSEPKKPRKPKAKKVNVSEKAQWEQILKTVTKSEVPVEVLKSITVNLTDGTEVHIDIKELLAAGQDPRDIEDHINERLETLDNYIDDIDFFICIESVVKVVRPVTDELLKHI